MWAIVDSLSNITFDLSLWNNENDFLIFFCTESYMHTYIINLTCCLLFFFKQDFFSSVLKNSDLSTFTHNFGVKVDCIVLVHSNDY